MTTLDDAERQDAVKIASVALDLWDGETDSDGKPCDHHMFYQCGYCDQEWETIWSCDVDDECSGCGREYISYRCLVYNWETGEWEDD